MYVKRGERYYSRKFNFKRTEDGIVNQQVKETRQKKCGDNNISINQKKGWEIPSKISAFCERLIECFLPLFVNNEKLQIALTDKNANESKYSTI